MGPHDAEATRGDGEGTDGEGPVLADADVDVLVSALRTGGVTRRVAAARELDARSRRSPDAVAPAAEALAAAADDDLAEVAVPALAALVRLSGSRPGACAGAAEALAAGLAVPDGETDVPDRRAVGDPGMAGQLEALARTGTERAWVEVELRLVVLVRVAAAAPETAVDALAPRRETLAALLGSHHERVRGLVTALYAELAEREPAAARAVETELVESLDVEEPSVRQSAVLALRWVDTPTAARALRRAAEDDHPDVAAAARAARRERGDLDGGDG